MAGDEVSGMDWLSRELFSIFCVNRPKIPNKLILLLSKGDMFQIPPGNVYRIENHSKTEDAKLFWTIIKSSSRANEDMGDSDSGDE